MKTHTKLLLGWVTLLLILIAAVAIRCQEYPTPEPTPESPRFEAHPKHYTAQDAEDDMAFMSVKILSIDAHYYYMVRESKTEVKALAFRYDNLTYADVSSGRACIVYCKTHLFLYVVTACRNK